MYTRTQMQKGETFTHNHTHTFLSQVSRKPQMDPENGKDHKAKTCHWHWRVHPKPILLWGKTSSLIAIGSGLTDLSLRCNKLHFDTTLNLIWNQQVRHLTQSLLMSQSSPYGLIHWSNLCNNNEHILNCAKLENDMLSYSNSKPCIRWVIYCLLVILACIYRLTWKNASRI